jgi:hypothetical protein
LRAELKLARGIRLRRDRARGRWMLLGPERGHVLNDEGHRALERLLAGERVDEAFIAQLVERRLVEAT